MGQLRFVTPAPERITAELVERAYLSNLEGVPWKCQARLENNSLTIERPSDEAGNLNIPWIVPGHGQLVITTTSLMQRSEAYQLEIELARGTLNRLRNSVNIASLSGWDVPATIRNEMDLAQQLFIRAATSQHIPSQAAHWAQESLTHSLQGAEDFGLERARYLLHSRQQQSSKLPTLWGVQCESKQLRQRVRKVLSSAFNSMGVSMPWKRVSTDTGKFEWDHIEKQIRWCRKKEMKVIAGPLVHLTEENVPDWVYLWEDDFPTIQSYYQDYVREAVSQFSDQVHIWNCLANLNVDNCLSLSEEQLLQLAVSTIETLRQCDPKTPLIFTISQPWGEYLSNQSMDMSPMSFAELLIRTDLGINGIGLEINWGYRGDEATLPRDLLELSQQIDRWSQLGVPLVIYLTITDSPEVDEIRGGLQDVEGSLPQQDRSGQKVQSTKSQSLPHDVESLQRETPDESAQDISNSDDTIALTSRTRNVLTVLASKPAVQALVWKQLADTKSPADLEAGLFDVTGKSKPILKDLLDLRQNYMT